MPRFKPEDIHELRWHHIATLSSLTPKEAYTVMVLAYKNAAEDLENLKIYINERNDLEVKITQGRDDICASCDVSEKCSESRINTFFADAWRKIYDSDIETVPLTPHQSDALTFHEMGFLFRMKHKYRNLIEIFGIRENKYSLLYLVDTYNKRKR